MSFSITIKASKSDGGWVVHSPEMKCEFPTSKPKETMIALLEEAWSMGEYEDFINE